MNIPLIVTLPGKKHAGTELPQLVSNGVDFFATVCDFGGAKMPSTAAGHSFRHVVESGAADTPHQDYIITETRFDGSNTRGWMVRTPTYKYVLYDKGRNREQFFNMISDPGEMRNLTKERTYDEELQRHRDILAEWMEKYRIHPTRPKLHDVPGKKLTRTYTSAYK